jgi:hypothetical protein
MSTVKVATIPVPTPAAPAKKTADPVITTTAATKNKVVVNVPSATGTPIKTQPSSTATGTPSYTTTPVNTTQTAPKPKTTVTNSATAVGTNGHASYL